MRNLKRALSLTLASVMLLGMMVVGSSAAAGYDDVAETDNVEAIEVLQAVQVMVGDERGFGPERPVNRAEMAVVMGKLLNLDYNYYEAICPFNDVYDWARGWVGACYANGIVSGRGEGVYDPGTTVTAVEAASMLMRALGYFKYQSDYSAGFETATVLQANKIRLFDGVDSTVNAPLTRNQVAQMALNALKTGMVEPDGNTLNFIDTNGNIIASGGKVNYVNVTSNKAFATAIDDVKASSMGSANDAPIVELGEQLYNGDLKLRDDIDAFGRPSRHWEYDAKEIGTYVKKELIKEEYTVKVTGRTLHDLLGSTTLKDYDLDVYIDGVEDPDINPAVFGKTSLVRTNDVGVGATGKGVLTQVFLDADAKLITIAVINTYLAIADEDFDDRTDDVNVTVYGIQKKTVANQYSEYVKNAKNDDGTSANQNEGFKLETEDFPEIVDVKDGDAFLVNVADGEVQTLGKPEILSSAQITSFKQADWLVTGGTQYDFASAAEYECETLYDYTITGTGVINLKDINYDIYLDQFGYAIGVKEVDRVDNYLFITGLDTNTNNRYAVQADASAIFLDGTMESIKVDMKAARDLNDQTYNALTNGEKGGSLVNKWFSYTVGSNGIYEVVLVGDETTVEKTRAGQFRTLSSDEAADIANDGHETYLNKELIEYYNKSLDGIVTGLGGSHGVDEISRKSIALRGADAPNSTWYSVYGDDKSVYITAELKTIQDAHGEQTIVNVIGGVDNVAVGIDEASIDVYTKAEALKKDRGANVSSPATRTAHGSYVLYDKDGDIIAAVVVGEDAGSVTNLVYTHKERIESETDNNASGSSTKANSVKGDYTWTRKVVSDGEEILLTEVGSGLSKLKNMLPYTWYVVKYNAKGEVKNVYPAWDTDASYGAYYGNGYKGMISDPTGKENPNTVRLEDKYVNNIEELNQATNENSMVLYEVGQYNTGRKINGAIVRSEWDGAAVGSINWLGGPNTEIVNDLRKSGKPQVDNHTLYITTDTNESYHRGFRVADDVKTVFIQKNNNDWTTTFESGYSRLERVINRLHDHDETGAWANSAERNYYHYEISAVMSNGKATVIVIRDLNNAGATITTPERSYNLKLYGNLFTSPNTVTGASNTVVMANDVEVKPTTTGNDSKGNYTVYSIPQGAMVGITDYDIDAAGVIFGCIYNYEIENLQLRAWQRTITFNMPAHESWIIGGTSAYFTGNTVGTVTRANVPVNTVVTFDGQPVNSKIPGKGIEDKIEIKISGLEPSTEYTVTLGDPAKTVKDTTDAAGNFPAFDYELTGNDIYNGYVNVAEIKATGNVGPVDRQVTIPAGVTVSYTKDGATVTVDGPKTAAIPDGTAITITVTEAGKKAQIGGVDVTNPYTVNGNVIITLVDEGPIEDGKVVTVTLPARGYINVIRDGVTISKTNNLNSVMNAEVKTGEVISVDPEEVFTVTGVDAAGKVTGDVTITAKSEYRWDGTFYSWVKKDNGELVDNEAWVVGAAAAVNVPAKRFGVARNADGSLVKPGETQVDTSDPNWFRPYRDGKTPLEFRTLLSTGKIYVISIKVENNKIFLAPVGDYTPEEVEEYEELAADRNNTTAVAPADPAPSTESGLRVTMSNTAGGWAASITVYDKDGKKAGAVTKEQVAAALNSACKAEGLSYVFAAADIKSAAEANNGMVKITLRGLTAVTGSFTVNTQVYKITYPGGEAFVSEAGGDIDNVEAGVTGLIPQGKDVAPIGTGFSVTVTDLKKPGTVTTIKPLTNGDAAADETLAEYKDTVYVPAVRLNGGDDAENTLNKNGVVKGGSRALLVVSVLDENKEAKLLNPTDFVRIGASILVNKDSSVVDAANKSIVLKANNKDALTLPVKADDSVDQAEYVVGGETVSAGDGIYVLALSAELKDAAALPVYLDGVELTNKDGDDYLVAVEKGKSIVAWNSTHECYGLVNDASSVAGANTRITPADMQDENGVQLGLSEDEKSIQLFTATKTATEGTIGNDVSAVHWKAYTMEKGEYVPFQTWKWSDADSQNKGVDHAYILDNQMGGLELYIVADRAGVILGWADTHEIVGELFRSPVGAGVVGNTTALTGVWKWTADKALKTNSFEVLVSVTMANNSDKVDVKLTENSDDFGKTGITAGEHKVTLAGVTAQKDVSWITAKWDKAVEGMTLSGVSVTQEGKVTLTITVEEDAAVVQPDRGEEDVTVGTITFNLGENIYVPVLVKVPAKTS